MALIVINSTEIELTSIMGAIGVEIASFVPEIASNEC